MTEPIPAAPAPAPKRPKRWRRRVAIGLFLLPTGLLALVVALVLTLPLFVSGDRVRQELVSALTDALGTEVQIERVEYSLLGGAEIFGIRIGPPPGFERDVFQADRLSLGYELGGLLRRRVVVREVALDAPHAVMETRGDRTNIQVILAHLAERYPPSLEEEPASAPLSGPLTPVDVELADLVIGPLGLELAGDGPNVKITRGWLRANATLDRERLEAEAELSFVQKGEGEALDNVIADVPEQAGAPSISARSDIGFSQRLVVSARTSDGLAVERLVLANDTSIAADISYGKEQLPPVRIQLAYEAELLPAQGEVALSKLEASFNGEQIASASFRLAGLYDLLVEVMGETAAASLSPSIGLSREGEATHAYLEVNRFALPLSTFAPYARLFEPTLRMEGEIVLSGVKADGTPKELTAGLPPVLTSRIDITGVRVDWPAQSLSLRALDGSFELSRNSVEVPRYLGSGNLQMRGVRLAGTSVDTGTMTLALALEQLSYPIPGAFAAELGIALQGVSSTGTTVERARFDAGLSGTDVLHADRPVDVPIAVRAHVEASGVVSRTATTSSQVSRVTMDVKATLDRLLEPARRPIDVDTKIQLDAFADGAGTQVEALAMDVTTRLGDPRRLPFDAKADVTLSAKRVRTAAAELNGLTMRTGLTATGVGPHVIPEFPGGAPSMLPAQMEVRLDMAAQRAFSTDPSLGTLQVGFKLGGELSADLVGATANLSRVTLAVDDLIAATAHVRMRRIYSKEPFFDASFDVPSLDLAKLVSRTPASLKGAAPDLAASGQVAFRLEARGRVPAAGSLDLADLPAAGELSVRLTDVGLTSPGDGIELKGLSGAFTVGARSGRAEVGMDLTADSVRSERTEVRSEVDGVVLRANAGLVDGVWAMLAELDAKRLKTTVGTESAEGPASMAMEVKHPVGGDVSLSRFDISMPGAGLEMHGTGRLARRSFGVLSPELHVEGWTDLTRLRALAPQVGNVDGRVGMKLTIAPVSERVVDVDGMLWLENFSYLDPPLVLLEGASGRVPIQQRITLPVPKLDEKVARALGAFGDDLEARVDELSRRFSLFKVHLDSEDILIVAPRTPDYQALRPYYAAKGAEMTIERLVYGGTVFDDVSVESLWRSGVFRVDRFQAKLWEGDVIGDVAIQLTSDLNVRARMRGTVTDLNLDIPYAIAKGIEPIQDPKKKDDYRIVGTMDIEFALKERTVNARVDLMKLSLPLVDRLFGAMDPQGESAAVKALKMSERVGVRPVSGKIWITENLMSVTFDFQRLWVHVDYQSWNPLDIILDTILIPGRIVTIPTAGAYVINTMNGAIRRLSVGNILDQVITESNAEDRLIALEGKVISTDAAEPESRVAQP